MVLCSMFGRYSTFADGKLNAKKLNIKHKTMNKFKKTVLMLCLILSGAFCYAHSEVEMNQKEDGTSIIVCSYMFVDMLVGVLVIARFCN